MKNDPKLIFSDLKEKLIDGSLKIPGLPDIAHRVQRAISHDDYNVSDVARIIQTDIPLSGRIIQIANSPLYKGVVPVDTCQAAVNRLGMKVVRNLVTSFAVRRLYSLKDSHVRKQIEKLWKHSVKIGAISFTLARVTPGFDPEHAMLAGLTHDIGELVILQYVELNQDLLKDENLLREFIQRYKSKLSGVILKHWRFEEEIIRAALDAENWMRDPADSPDIADVVMSSHIMEMVLVDELPQGVSSFKELPVYRKFPVFKLGEFAHRELMMESQEEISELQKLLR